MSVSCEERHGVCSKKRGNHRENPALVRGGKNGMEQVKWHTEHCHVQEGEQIHHHGHEQDESPGDSMVSSQPPAFPWFIFYHTHQGRIPALPRAKHDLFQGQAISATSEISSPVSLEGLCYVAPKPICWKITWWWEPSCIKIGGL